jgi:SAM-dependent methyltransferase
MQMKDHEDAFGHALLDYYLGGEAQIIIERDDGNLDVSGEPEMYFREFDQWEEYERKAMGYVSGRALDIGSGAGRHALYLQGKGNSVVALDNSPLAVEVLKRRGVREVALVAAAQISSKLGAFDSILMMGNNFGLVANTTRAKWLFRRFHSMTTENANIVATTLDPLTTTDPIHLAYHERNRRRGRMPGQVRIRARYRNFIGQWFDYLFVTLEELKSIISDTGWTLSDVIESEGPVYVAIITKKN